VAAARQQLDGRPDSRLLLAVLRLPLHLGVYCTGQPAGRETAHHGEEYGSACHLALEDHSGGQRQQGERDANGYRRLSR